MLFGPILDVTGEPLRLKCRNHEPGNVRDGVHVEVELHVHPGGRVTAVEVVPVEEAEPVVSPDATREPINERLQPRQQPIVADEFRDRREEVGGHIPRP